MMLRTWISAVVTGLLLSGNVVLAAHSPTAWTQGHYSGSELSDDDVVAYWAFDEPEKDGLVVVEDGSRRGNVLVENPVSAARAGVVKLGPGKSGKAYFSDTATSSDRACRAMSADFNLKRAFTVEMWFKIEPGLWAKGKGRHMAFFCLDDQCLGGQETPAMGQLVQIPDAPPNTFYLVFHTRVDDKPRSEYRDMFIRHKVILPGGKWHHVAFTWDGERMRTYLDGKLVGEAKQPKGELLDAAEIYVGSHFWMSGFLGSIDSVRVLDRAIAFAEPGKQPTVQPRNVRNSTGDAPQTSEKRTKKHVWVRSGDSFPAKADYLSHGRAGATRVAADPRIDGRLDDAAWQRTTAYGNFMDNTDHSPSKDQAEFRICHDDKNLYFGITVHDRNVRFIRKRATGDERDAPVYDDDSIEVFLDTNGDRKTYYHVAVNANGAIYDARIDGEVDKSWNGVTQAAASVDRGKWFVELAVSLVALGVEDINKVRHMGFNVGREQYSRDGHLLSQWVPGLTPTGGFHTPRSFGVLVFGEAVEAGAAFNAPKLQATWSDGELTLDMPVTGRVESPGRIVIEFSDGALEQWSKVTTGVPKAGRARVAIPLQPAWKRCFVRLRLPDPRAPDMVPKDMLVAAFGLPDLLAMRFLQPHYRDSIYADQKLDNVVVEIQSALPHPVELSFGPRGGKATVTRGIESALEPVTVKMPAKGLADGKHDVTARLVTAGGNAVFSKTITLRKLPAYPHTVRMRKDGVWLRHGKPYMPLGYFSLSVRNKKGWTIAEMVREQGMNAGQSYFHQRRNDGAIRALLDGAAKHGVSMLIIPWSDKGGLEARVPEMSDVVRTQVSEKVNLFKDHPGLLGWYMADEPELQGVTASWLRDMYELIRELDPYHPCIVLNNTLAGVTRYSDVADISMPDPYIVPLKAGPPNSSMTKIAAFMDAVRRAGKPAWITPEAFNYASQTPAHFMARAPNYTEQRCIAFLAMVHGARGYVYHVGTHCLPEPQLRIGMPYVMRELRFTSKVLTSKGSDLPVRTRRPVSAFARRTAGAFMLVAVNPSRRPVEATLSCEGLPKELHVLSEDRTVRPADGKISDRFEPYGVHIYTTAAGADRLATVAKAKEHVAAYKRRLAEENKNNLAFVGNGGKIRASSQKESMYLNDGTVDHIECRASPRPGRPAWVEVTLAEARPVARVVMDTTPYTEGYRLHDARALLRVGGKWKAVAQVAGNRDRTVFEFKFPATTTDAVRIEITKPYSTVALCEIRVFGASAK